MSFLLGVLSCTPNASDGVLLNLEPTEQVKIVAQENPSLNSDELPPERNSAKTKAIVDSIAAGQIAFTQFKACHILDAVEGEAPKGQFLYAWNETSTVGLVLSIYQLSLKNMHVGTPKKLSVTDGDAFIMIEIGDRVDTNFCVPDIQQIPIATVLESHTGTVEIQRTETGIKAKIGKILFRDQYTDAEVLFNGLIIPSQKLVSP